MTTRIHLLFLVLAGLHPFAQLDAASCFDTNTALDQQRFIADMDITPAPVNEAYQMYERLRIAHPEVARVFPQSIIYKMMDAPEAEYLIHRLKGTMERFQGDTTSSDDTVKLTGALREELKDKVPASQIEERVALMGSQVAENVERVLGYMTVDEVQLLVHGGNALQPTPESLLGKYIQETGASSVVRTFGQTVENRQPNPNGPQGPQRLVIGLSQESMPIYLKYFGRLPNFMQHLHGVSQGTLMVGFMGRAGSYANLDRGEPNLRFSAGAIWPHILLSTSEGGRTRLYFDLRQTYVKEPWARGYCATGGYSSCTHWWGEAGISDRRVTEWVFPGAVDQYASNNVSTDPAINRQPRVQPLAQFQMPTTDRRALRMLQRFFTLPTAGEQLAVMLGTRRQLEYGEWANPGYVAITLLGHANPARVPFLFYHVTDHRQPIPLDFNTGISAY